MNIDAARLNSLTTRPSKKRLYSLIKKTEEKYKQCWSVLLILKPDRYSDFSAEQLFKFQPMLCEALLDLDREYRLIEQEKNRLIARKKSIDKSWFNKRMKLLKRYHTTILQTIKVGKFLGDSFAWFFYNE